MAARPRFGWQSSRVSQRRRGAVDPVELARHPPAGLVEVHGVGLAQRARTSSVKGSVNAPASATIWARAPTDI